MSPKISLCMIAKNEEANLAQCLPTIAPHVDELIIVDTGSTDRTREVAKSFGARVYQYDQHTNPEAFFLDNEETCKAFGYNVPNTYSNELAFADFGGARNESFKHATGDYILWVDSDDVVENGHRIRAIADDLTRKPNAFGFLRYDYARDDKERTFYSQWRERVVPKGSATWLNRVHEVLMPNAPIVPIRYEDMLIIHRRKPDRKQTPNRNYKILLRQLKADYDAGRKPDPRTLFYLGQESRFIEPMRAIGFYEEYLKHSGWPEERAAAHCAIGEIFEFGQVQGVPLDEAYARANREFATAAAEVPENPDGVFGLARIAHLRDRQTDCIRYTETGLKIGNTDSMLGMNPMNRLYRPHAYYNLALARVGRYADAAASCRAALGVCPDDPGVPGGSSGMLTFNLKVYEANLKNPAPAPAPVQQRAPKEVALLGKDEPLDTPPAANVPHDAFVIWTIQLWKRCVAERDATRARGLLASLPPSIAADAKVREMERETIKRFGPPPPSPQELADQATAIFRGAARQLMALSSEPAMGAPEIDDLHEVTVRMAPVTYFGREAIGYVEGEPKANDKRPAATRAGLSIVFWIGPAFEPWDPTTPNTKGIGGSETACIEMARNFAAMGHRVTVYGDCERTAGDYDGVTYKHFQSFQSIDCDVFISSRQPAIMDAIDRINAKLKLLWVHDINVGGHSPQLERWLLRFDRILCLSEWHKGFFCSSYPTLHPDRVIVTRNGIDPDRFANPLPKTNRLIFSSSPNRGLMNLLSMFPAIRAQVPDAELHVYYGTHCWKTMAKMRNDPQELAVIEKYDRATEGVPGVFNHGLTNQKELAESFLRSKVWLYPSLGPELFPETSCVSAMEAMAAGAVPITVDYAALPETVKYGYVYAHDNPNTPAGMVRQTIMLLENEDARAKVANAGRDYALNNLSWKSLAEDWAAMFGRLITEVAANPISAWRAA